MHGFRAPEIPLGEPDAEATASPIAAAAYVAPAVDGAGVIRDFAVNGGGLSRELAGGEWSGRPWPDTVAEESRPKAEAPMRDAAARAAPRRRRVNPMAAPGSVSVPILFSAARLGRADRGAMASGGDPRAASASRRRPMEAQRSVERGRARLRQTGTRHPRPFRTSPEPVPTLDAAAQKAAALRAVAPRRNATGVTSYALGMPVRAFAPRPEAAMGG